MYKQIGASLDMGREQTKKWFAGLSEVDKRDVIDRMKKLKAFSIASYLAEQD